MSFELLVSVLPSNRGFWYRFLVKVQFRGPELFKKKGTLFQEELYLPGIFMPSRTRWRYICKWMASISMYFLCFCRYDFAIRQPLHRHNIQPRTYQRRYWHVVVMLCNVWLAESSRVTALWRHDHNDDYQNMAVLPIVGGRLAMLTKENLPSEYNVNEMKKYVNLKMKT